MKTLILLCSLLLATSSALVAGPAFFAGQQGVVATSSAAFSPADVSGLAMWFVADDIAGSDGDAVGSWSAHSPTTISASQSTASAKPSLQVSEVNGHNAVLSDGVNDVLDLSANVSSSASWTVFTVQKRASSGSLGAALGSIGTIVPPYSPLEYGSLSRMYIGSRTDQKYSSIPTHAWHVITGQDNAGTLGMWVDGSSQSLTAAAATGSADFGRLFARGTGGAVEYWATYVSEVLFYSRTLTSTERANVEAYLKSRYGTP